MSSTNQPQFIWDLTYQEDLPLYIRCYLNKVYHKALWRKALYIARLKDSTPGFEGTGITTAEIAAGIVRQWKGLPCHRISGGITYLKRIGCISRIGYGAYAITEKAKQFTLEELKNG